LERLDPATEKGKALRDDLKTDIAGPQPFSNVPLQEVRKRVAELQVELDDPLLKPAAQAWANKSKADPAWYSLVAKPNNLRELAKSLDKLSMYELHYRPWCRQVHATDTIANLSSTQDGITFRFQYEYDFGDSWYHEVLFEGVVRPDPKAKYPLCLEGERACPPEDCGGVWGYPDFVEAIRNPDDERHEELLEWIGGRFDPEAFDPVKATKAMRKGLPDWRSRAGW
jgi:hypothetical protein